MIHTFSKDSIHYRLATVYGKLNYYEETNMCTYIKHMFLGCFIVLTSIIIGSIFGYIFLDSLIWLYVSIMSKEFLEISPTVVFSTALIFFINFVFVIEYYIDKFGSRKKSFLSLAVDSVKNKYCLKINFK